MRIWSSAPSTYTYGSPTYSLPTLPLSDISAYDHTQDISSGNYGGELQLVNGAIRTPAGGIGYLDYTSTYYETNTLNTVNYSNIATDEVGGYRYATFAWQLPIMTQPIGNAIKFTFSDFLNLTPPPGGAVPVRDSDSNPIFICYMFVDSTNPNGYNANNTSILTSSWVDANGDGTNGIPVSSSGFNNPVTSVYSGLSSLATYSSNTLTITPIFPGIMPTTNTISLVLRVGLTINSPASFSSVAANLA